MVQKKTNSKNNGKSGMQIKDDKLKPLIPTLREKKRFVKVRIEGKRKFGFKELSEDLTHEIIWYLGAIDFGKAGIWLLRDKFDYEKQEVVLKVGVKFKDKLIGALSLVRKIGDTNVKVSVLRVSGTLKGLEKGE